jgi:GT2 family glycosyltransferase
MKRVCIVVLNWNGWADTIACVRSLQQQVYQDATLLVVDNCSTDGSVAHIRQALPSVELITTSHNLGFGGGCNVGMRAAIAGGAEFIWLLNSDAMAAPNALLELVRHAGNCPGLGAVGSVLYEADQPQTVQLWGGGQVRLYYGGSRHLRAPGRLDFISGASVLLRVSALAQTGLFDEVAFFMYWEDTDLSFRLRAAGWGIDVAPAAYAWHRESSSLGKGSPVLDLYFTRSAVRFLRKHAPLPLVPIAMMLTRMLFKRFLLWDLTRVRAVIKGWREA